MNFLRGAYDPACGDFLLEDGTRLDLPGGRWRHDGSAILGIRPEHIVLAEGGTPARLELDEPTGSDTHITVSVGAQTLVAVLHERIAVAAGDSVAIGFLPGRAQLFDPATGMRLPPLTA
jgi:multiple sugar transport system ATP-binding protein